MKIALAQLNYHIGNFQHNVQKMCDEIEKAKAQGVDLVVFAELAVCGYPPRDFLEFDHFIEQCLAGVDEIARQCNGIAAIVGGPSFNKQPKGKRLFNSAFFLADGEVQRITHKGLLPTYDVFDEYRYFEPAIHFTTIHYHGHVIALTVCEDIWDIEKQQLYTLSPLEQLFTDEPDVIINIAASPFHYSHAESRLHVLQSTATRYATPAVYVNHVGAQTELIFDGGSMVVDARGTVVESLPYFEEKVVVFDLKDVQAPQVSMPLNWPKRIERIQKALTLGVKDYFRKMSFEKAIVGLSGGIDSAVVLTLAVEALGKENVWAVAMPSEFSSDHSVNDARALAENLGCKFDLIAINDVYNEVLTALSPQFKDLPFSLAEENIQARIRGLYLMALANKFGYVLLNTTNKSEAAVGYGTLYGDLAGGLSVIGDVYKTDVYALAKLFNQNREIIPNNIITKAPSAELRPNQKDSDSLPEYDVLDQILYGYIEGQKGPVLLTEEGFDKAVVDKVLKLVNQSEYKRHQSAPVLRVSPKAFGMGRRMPIVAKYLS